MALVIATPGTIGMMLLMMTVSIFTTGSVTFSTAAAAATPAAHSTLRTNPPSRIRFPMVIRTARITPAAAAEINSANPPPNNGAKPAGTMTVARLYIHVVYCFPLIFFSFFLASSADNSPVQYFLEISLTSTIRCILVPRSYTRRMTVTVSSPGRLTVTMMLVSMTSASASAVPVVLRICFIVSSTRYVSAPLRSMISPARTAISTIDLSSISLLPFYPISAYRYSSDPLAGI